jgi:hypothetical protein
MPMPRGRRPSTAQLSRIESERLKLPAPFGRQIAEPLDADAAGLMRHRTFYAEMVASAAVIELNRSNLCKGTRSCSIISVPGSAVTKRASGVSSGILVHQDHRSVLLRNELSASAATISECRSRCSGLFLIRRGESAISSENSVEIIEEKAARTASNDLPILSQPRCAAE